MQRRGPALHIGIVACSAEGAALCYRTICAEAPGLLGAHAHPAISLHGHSLAAYVQALDRDDWSAVGELMLDSARRLVSIGAQVLVCPDNTIHRALPHVRTLVPVPWLHIAEVVAAQAAARGFRRVAVLGTRWLVDGDVYPDALSAAGVVAVRPTTIERDEIHRIIMDELVPGEPTHDGVRAHQRIIERLRDDGCDAVILGCTEIPLDHRRCELGPADARLDPLARPSRARWRRPPTADATATGGHRTLQVIGIIELTPDEYEQWVASPFVGERLAGDEAVSAVVVRGATDRLTSPGSLPVVLCWMGAHLGGDGPAGADVVLGDADVDSLITRVTAAPVAACTLALLLRAQARTELSVEVGLTLESAAYSVLQAGPEFAAWRATASHRPADDDDRVVDVERDGDELAITLDRPRRHNAISAAVRDQLDEALALAEADTSIARVVLRGRGPSFCSGGDLGEFGTRPTPPRHTSPVWRVALRRRIDRLA